MWVKIQICEWASRCAATDGCLQCKCLLESASAPASIPAPLPPLSLSQGSPDRASCPNPLSFFFFFSRIFSMASRWACALFTNMLLAGSGLKLKQTKGDEVNRKPNQEEEKEVGRGGCCWPAIDQRGENKDKDGGVRMLTWGRSCRDQWSRYKPEESHIVAVNFCGSRAAKKRVSTSAAPFFRHLLVPSSQHPRSSTTAIFLIT